MTFHCFFDRHTHTHIHTVFGRVCCVCGCVFFSDARSSVTKGLSFFLPCLVRFFSAGRPQNNKINPLHRLCNNSQAGSTISFARIRLFFSFCGVFLADKNGHPPPVNPLQFQMLFTLSAKYFSPFEQSTFALSVSQPIFVTLSKDTPCVGEAFQTAFSNNFTPEE